MISVQEQRIKFNEAYARIVNNVPQELRERADCSVTWEQDFIFPHIDKNFVRQLPESVIAQLVELYETLRKDNL
jgi:hypothetical protein